MMDSTETLSDGWTSAFKRCMLYDLQIPHLYVADDPKLMTLGRSRVPSMSIEGYQLTLGINDNDWRFESHQAD